MDRINVMVQAQLNQRRNVQVRFDRLAWATDLVRFVGLETMKCITVFMSVYGDRAEPELGGTSKHSNSDFASVGNKQFFNRFHKYLV